MIKKKKKKKSPARNWISISIIMIIVQSFVIYLYKNTFFEGIFGFFSFLYMLAIWFLIFVYVFANVLRERPDFELRKSFVKIKKIEVYESWYFLTASGLIFALIVIAMFLNFGEYIGGISILVLYGFLFALIRDILKHRRDKS